ncbi:hypothetical protein HK096_005472 [Nowakowskiella sp. JEL0078]|nr:hypothetical protein HK096_005472 [Nowakowskiella sp. JEL0078]
MSNLLRVEDSQPYRRKLSSLSSSVSRFSSGSEDGDDSIGTPSSAVSKFEEDLEGKLLALNRELSASGFRPLPFDTLTSGLLSPTDFKNIIQLTRRLYDTMRNSQNAVDETVDRSARLNNDNKTFLQRVERLQKENMDKDRIIENLRFQLENADRKSRDDFGDLKKKELELSRLRRLKLPGNIHHHHYVNCEHQDSKLKDSCDVCESKTASSPKQRKLRNHSQGPFSASVLDENHTLVAPLMMPSITQPVNNNTTFVVKVVVNQDDTKTEIKPQIEVETMPTQVKEESKEITKELAPGLQKELKEAGEESMEELQEKIRKLQNNFDSFKEVLEKSSVLSKDKPNIDKKPTSNVKTNTKVSTEIVNRRSPSLDRSFNRTVRSPLTGRISDPLSRRSISTDRTLSNSPKTSTAPNIPRPLTPLSPGKAAVVSTPKKKRSAAPTNIKTKAQEPIHTNLSQDEMSVLLEKQAQIFGAILTQSPAAGLYPSELHSRSHSPPISPISTVSTDFLFASAPTHLGGSIAKPKEPSQRYLQAMVELEAFDENTQDVNSHEYLATSLPLSVKKRLKDQLDMIRERWNEVEHERELVTLAAVQLGKEREVLNKERELFEEEKRDFRTAKVLQLLDSGLNNYE